MRPKSRALIFVFTPLWMIGCGSDDSPDTSEDTLNCPGVIAYDEPLVDIISVTNRETGESLAQVTLSELMINEREARFDYLNKRHMNNIETSSDGQSAVCTLPCGLFTADGDYSMLVSAPNFASKRVEFEASYDSVDYERCPTTYYGNRELSVDLVPFEVVSCPATSDYTLLGEEEVHDPFEVVIEDPHEFRELYLSIDPSNQEEIPAIDFDEKTAVFIYLGQQTNTYPEVRLKDVTSNEEGITVKYENVQPSSGCVADNALSEPYCIISLPKTGDPIRFSMTTVRECVTP